MVEYMIHIFYLDYANFNFHYELPNKCKFCSIKGVIIVSFLFKYCNQNSHCICFVEVNNICMVNLACPFIKIFKAL